MLWLFFLYSLAHLWCNDIEGRSSSTIILDMYIEWLGIFWIIINNDWLFVNLIGQIAIINKCEEKFSTEIEEINRSVENVKNTI